MYVFILPEGYPILYNAVIQTLYGHHEGASQSVLLRLQFYFLGN